MAAIGRAARQPTAICDQSGLCRMRCAKRRSQASLAGACVRARTRSSQPASVSRTITSIIVWTRYRIDVGIAPPGLFVATGPRGNAHPARYVSKHNKRGERFSWRGVPMRGWPPAPLDPMKFPLILAGQLRRAFNHVGSSPLPQKLAELVRRVKSDETDARKGG
jgi:hypothetical protein